TRRGAPAPGFASGGQPPRIGGRLAARPHPRPNRWRFDRRPPPLPGVTRRRPQATAPNELAEPHRAIPLHAARDPPAFSRDARAQSTGRDSRRTPAPGQPPAPAPQSLTRPWRGGWLRHRRAAPSEWRWSPRPSRSDPGPRDGDRRNRPARTRETKDHAAK